MLIWLPYSKLPCILKKIADRTPDNGTNLVIRLDPPEADFDFFPQIYFGSAFLFLLVIVICAISLALQRRRRRKKKEERAKSVKVSDLWIGFNWNGWLFINVLSFLGPMKVTVSQSNANVDHIFICMLQRWRFAFLSFSLSGRRWQSFIWNILWQRWRQDWRECDNAWK